MQHKTYTTPEEIDAQNENEGNEDGPRVVYESEPDATPRDSRGIPVTMQKSLGDLFAEHGIEAEDTQLPYFRVKSKAQKIRVVGLEPTPGPRAFRDSTIVTLARLKVEEPNGSTHLLDVTSGRLLAQLRAIPFSTWFTICKFGTGMGTTYAVALAPEGA